MGGTLQSRYIPDELQGSAMNLCRLPLNILVVVGTKLTDLVAMPTVFAVCASWFTLGLLCQCLLAYVGPVPSDKKKKDAMVVAMRFSPDRSSRKIGGTCFQS